MNIPAHILAAIQQRRAARAAGDHGGTAGDTTMSDVELRIIAEGARWYGVWRATGDRRNYERYLHFERLYHRQLEARWAQEDSKPNEQKECPECGSDLEHVTCPNCGGVRVEHATGWACGECDEDGAVLMCVQRGCERRGVVVEVSA